ncbi:hypothetical protein E4U41_004559 [Claviceps citrina]|nr:hypothetical protein E4U41_004559 [Claviceps citrina]
MASHHEPLKALAPVDWNDVPRHDLKTFMNNSFGQAQIVIDSVPAADAADAAKPAPTGRARAKTDSAVVYSQHDGIHASSPIHDAPPAAADAAQLSARLRKEWKEIRTSPKDNPLGISVYKLPGKDGRGAWFARRSVHVGLSFARWKTGLRREFAESMRVQGSPGSGNIRGIGADRNVEHHVVEGAGHLDVFQLSAQFPGPTAPRDFITLLLTSDFSHPTEAEGQRQPPRLRQYMIVSKPCVHPECPPRQGIVRGQYESVEVVREMPLGADSADAASANKRSLSSADLMSGEDRATNRAGDDVDDGPRAFEWLMITRSDPGGSVPRFLIEKGTPPGIIGDAGKFLDWVTATTAPDGDDTDGGLAPAEVPAAQNPGSAPTSTRTTSSIGQAQDAQRPSSQSQDAGIIGDWTPSSTGLYGIITGALGVAGAIASELRSQFSIPLSFTSSQESLNDSQAVPEEDEDGGAGAGADDQSDDASSVRSFASAPEELDLAGEEDKAAGSSTACSDEKRPQPLEKDLQKLLERRQKLDRNYTQFQERMQSKRQGIRDKDAASLARLRDKHDREAARQEAKYRRDMRKLEEKREQEERKAEARRRKAAERREKESLTLELEKARADRDVAVKEAQLLREQVGELQAQNTMLVARMGRLGGAGG